jgi:hypothetical protein
MAMNLLTACQLTFGLAPDGGGKRGQGQENAWEDRLSRIQSEPLERWAGIRHCGAQAGSGQSFFVRQDN